MPNCFDREARQLKEGYIQERRKKNSGSRFDALRRTVIAMTEGTARDSWIAINGRAFQYELANGTIMHVEFKHDGHAKRDPLVFTNLDAFTAQEISK